MKNKLKLKTKRLVIYPLSDLEIQELINKSSADLALAYTAMLEACQNNPEKRIWYAPWAMETKDENRRIGYLGFKGVASEGSVEIGYGINKEYELRGYTSEAAKALVNWALDNEEVMFVEAEANEDNAASIRILEKLGFQKYGQGEEGSRFVKSKEDTSYTSIGICLGLCLGLSLGNLVFQDMTLGMCIGLALGVSIGAAKDKKNKQKISQMKQDRYGI